MTESQLPKSDAFKPVRGIFIIILAVTALVAFSKFHQAKEIIPWRTDYLKAREESRTTNKPLFLYFTAEWCGPCEEMKHSTWADERVDAALKKYVPVRIDIDQHPDIAAAFHIDPIPDFFVIDIETDKVTKAAAGGMDPEDFLKWIKR